MSMRFERCVGKSILPALAVELAVPAGEPDLVKLRAAGGGGVQRQHFRNRRVSRPVSPTGA